MTVRRSSIGCLSGDLAGGQCAHPRSAMSIEAMAAEALGAQLDRTETYVWAGSIVGAWRRDWRRPWPDGAEARDGSFVGVVLTGGAVWAPQGRVQVSPTRGFGAILRVVAGGAS
jgi:hypothetical protein